MDSIWRKPVSTHASSICCTAGFGEFGESLHLQGFRGGEWGARCRPRPIFSSAWAIVHLCYRSRLTALTAVTEPRRGAPGQMTWLKSLLSEWAGSSRACEPSGSGQKSAQRSDLFRRPAIGSATSRPALRSPLIRFLARSDFRSAHMIWAQDATGGLRLLNHVCGTRCRLIYGCVTVLNSLLQTSAQDPSVCVWDRGTLWRLVRSAVYKYSYLLTYCIA